MIKMIKNLFKKWFGKEESVSLQTPVEVVKEPVKVIEERLAEVAENKVVSKPRKITPKVEAVIDAPTEVKKPRRKRKPKAKIDKPADGEQK